VIRSVDTWLIIAGMLILIDLFLVWGVFFARAKSHIREEKAEAQKKAFLRIASGKSAAAKIKIDPSGYLLMKKLIHLDEPLDQRLEEHVNLEKLESRCLGSLRSGRKVKRAEAIFALGRLGTQKARLALEKQLLEEKNFTLKLYIANALSDIRDKQSIPVLIYSLVNASRFYRTRVNMLICDFGKDLHDLLPELTQYDRVEIQELLIDFASVYFSQDLKDYLVGHLEHYEAARGLESKAGREPEKKICGNCVHGRMVADANSRSCPYHGSVPLSFSCGRYRISPASINSFYAYKELSHKACGVLAEYYPKEFYEGAYLNSSDLEIRRIALRGLANFHSPQNMKILLKSLSDKDLRQSAVHGISMIVEGHPAELAVVEKAFLSQEDAETKKALAEVLSTRIEYYITRLTGKEKEKASLVVEEVILSGRTSEVIDFLNRNKNAGLAGALISIIKHALQSAPELGASFSRYLEDRLCLQCGLASDKGEETKIKPVRDKKFAGTLTLLLALNLLFVPCLFLFIHWQILPQLSWISALKLFVKDFNFYFIFYSISINFIYFSLLFLSFVQVSKQKKLWEMKDTAFLFKKRMLPSISILAPAFNEARTIIQNVNSLLNLKYPEYELIVVNDGSTDRTLQILIEEFGLKKVDRFYKEELAAKAVKGIYINRDRPKLIVVDKMNGGKADSLNAGINVASKEYICSIDSDSILEEDALLKLASTILDEDVETPAMGGNVLPINGCKVEQGVVEDIRIPAGNLGKFQTVEYIRAFMSGRLGWSLTNNLLIISGAFGLFRKERSISVGGYLTGSGEYKKDTVGEDMEIVVRICRRMRESGRKYRIRYAFNANCWTEVPEDFSTLKKQRYRWQRGLIEIIYFHQRMLFNPRYGSTGLVALPYFFLFEVMGPIIEVQGYIVILLALLLGVLYVDIALLLFVAVVLTGTLISISSLLIIEQNRRMFTAKDTFRLLLCALAENFGMRQYMSLLRVGGYFRSIKASDGWDKAERKGFARASGGIKGGKNEK
jgi:peptidoglycan-N-acetylglucosamine deacetylase